MTLYMPSTTLLSHFFFNPGMRYYAQIPDGTIAALYPVEDNYVNDDAVDAENGDGTTRSPKSLAALACEQVCRTLPQIEGAGILPPGLPVEVVSDIIRCLQTHSALTATTLRALSQCELSGTLSLANCRGVTDEWFQPLMLSAATLSNASSAASLSTPLPFLPTATTPTTKRAVLSDPPGAMKMDHDDESMDVDDSKPDGDQATADPNTKPASSTIVYGTFAHQPRRDDDADDASSATSYVSARSNLYDHGAATTATTPATAIEPTDYHAVAATSFSSHPCTPPTQATSIFDIHDRSDMKMSPQTPTPAAPPSPSPSLGCLHNLTTLDLRGSTRLTDRGLLQLQYADLSSRLEIVLLDNCHSLTGKGLLVFAQCHHLTTVSLANCRRLTDEAIINISHLISIENLNLHGCR